MPQQAAGNGGGDTGVEWRLALVPPPLALDPHVTLGLKTEAGEGCQEHASMSADLSQTSRGLKDSTTLRGTKPPMAGEVVAFFHSPCGIHGVSPGRIGAPFIEQQGPIT
jgi:hypothetical protein